MLKGNKLQSKGSINNKKALVVTAVDEPSSLRTVGSYTTFYHHGSANTGHKHDQGGLPTSRPSMGFSV